MRENGTHLEGKLVRWLVASRSQGGFVVISFIAIIVFLASFYIFVPYDGLRTVNDVDGMRVVNVQGPAEQAGFVLGDKILKMNDERVVSQQGPIYPAFIGKGDIVVYDVKRGDESLILNSEMGGYADNLEDFGPIFGMHFLAACFWLIGAGLCLFAPYDDTRARLIGLGWLLAGVTGAAGSAAVLSHFWGGDALTIGLTMSGFILAAAHLYFPSPSFSTRRRGLLINGFGMIAGLLIIGHVLLSWILGEIRPVTVDISYWVFILSVIVSIGFLIKNRFFSESPDTRRQTGIILLSTVLSIGPFIVLTLLPMLIFGDPYIKGRYTILMLVLLPMVYAYVLHQRSLLKIDFVINRIVVFFILVLLIMFVSIAMLGLVAVAFDLSPEVPLLGGALATMIALPSAAVQKKVQVSVNRVLYGGHYDFSTVTSKLSNNLARALNRTTLVDLLTDHVAEEMGILQTALILLANGRLTLQTPDDPRSDFEVTDGEEACKLLLEAGVPVRGPNFWGLLSPVTRERWDRFSWGKLFVPMVLEEKLYGILILGPRLASEIYSDQDLQIIGTVAQQGALATSNLKLVEDLRGLTRQLVRTDEEQRKKLAGDLHDAVLQNLFFVKQHMLKIGQKEMVFHLDEVILNLRTAIKNQRPSVLDQGLPLALKDLIQDVQHLAGDKTPIRWRQDDDSIDDLRLTDEKATTFYRITQEALSNALKHSKAAIISVRLQKVKGKTKEKVRLIVEDNGIGMNKGYASRDGHHYGLIGMQERAGMIGADLQIITNPGKGTRVVLDCNI